MVVSQKNLYFLQGGGEMGTLTRQYDWARTSLGAPEHWPQSLRTVVSMMLSSRFPMFLWWGNDLLQFYNDAYRPSLGNEGKHPLALGQKGADCWLEAWDIIYPLIEQVRNDGKATWSEDQLVPIFRNGSVEDVYWTFGYSPVRGENDNVEGVLVICTETTEKVYNLKRMVASEQRFRNLIVESTIATAVLSGPNMVVEIANDAMLKMWGKDSSVIGKPLAIIMPELLNQRYVGLLKHVFDTGETITEEGALVYIKKGGKTESVYRDFSYKPLINETGEITSVLAVVVDVTDKVLVQKRLKESEQRFQGAVAALEGILWTNNYKGEMEGEQPGWAWLTGQSMNEYQGYGWASAVHPDDAQPTIEAWDEAVQHHKTFIFEHRVKKRNGEWGQFSIRAVPIFNDDRSVREWVGVHTDITQQRAAEQALKDSEKRYRMLTEEGTVATALYTGPEMLIQYVNGTMLRYWGKDSSVIGKTFREALPELEDQTFPGLLDAVYATGDTYVGDEELAYLEIEGKLQASYYNFTYKALRREDGTIYGIHHAAIEVTEQVLARKKLEESEQKVRALVESAPFPIAVYTGKEMLVELANKSIMDIWGKGDDVVGRLFTNVLPELGGQEVFEQIAMVFNTGESFHTRNQRLDLVVNGKIRPYWFNYSFTPLFDASGKVYGVMNTGVDNTDLVLAKLQVEENEKNIRNTILKAPVAMCIFRGPEHIVEIANDRMIELWGKTAADVLNKPIFEGLPEAKGQGFEELLYNVFSTGESVVADSVSVTLPRNGKIVPVFVTFVYEAFREAGGDITGVITVATDVTSQVIARQKIEEVVAERTKELAEANSNLQKSNAELAQFAYIASHDLQEPIRKVSTFTEMLEQSLGEIDERSMGYLGKIAAASSRMTTLIRDVLAYSQLSKEKEDYIPVNLNEVLDGIKSDFELLIEQKGAIVESDRLPVVDAIPLQMSQLFGNLVSNALKFCRKDITPVIKVSVSVLAPAQAVQYALPDNGATYYKIEFRDNGIGFKQEHADKIFNIFQRLHGKSEYAGTGIGLAMCRKIAQNHNGDIYATGALESGTTISVILPDKIHDKKLP